jgi:hypothetical protein
MDKIIEHDLPSETNLRADKMFFVSLHEVMKQELPRVSGNTRTVFRKHIKNIVSHPVVKKVVGEYPIGKLDFKKQVFVRLIKYELVDLLLLSLIVNR